jgi:adenylate cyclase
MPLGAPRSAYVICIAFVERAGRVNLMQDQVRPHLDSAMLGFLNLRASRCRAGALLTRKARWGHRRRKPVHGYKAHGPGDTNLKWPIRFWI